jgi:hypothetical protein
MISGQAIHLNQFTSHPDANQFTSNGLQMQWRVALGDTSGVSASVK